MNEPAGYEEITHRLAAELKVAAQEIDQLRSAIRLAHAGWPWSATKFQWLQLSIVHATLFREGKDDGNG